jgi:hypothetical protein
MPILSNAGEFSPDAQKTGESGRHRVSGCPIPIAFVPKKGKFRQLFC